MGSRGAVLGWDAMAAADPVVATEDFSAAVCVNIGLPTTLQLVIV